MHTEREPLQDAASTTADVVFVGCTLADAAQPVSPSSSTAPRRQVVVDGRQVKTVDVHAHCAVPEAMALMGLQVSPYALLIGAHRIQQMDQSETNPQRRIVLSGGYCTWLCHCTRDIFRFAR